MKTDTRRIGDFEVRFRMMIRGAIFKVFLTTPNCMGFCH
jgi:hypothetical protein